ncbi:hypothetical protein LOK49_LG01G02428 [Camellia lanceoleosa]|uniref:Uncharacterized protein n=1 Tax=Camellia lanceoleosa TaxID=1840588 RepID=A0ACC0IXH4_9ERIC|nr:hypothetical protein LOK49_LG01G02428 [Camellia lanceoleosa]
MTNSTSAGTAGVFSNPPLGSPPAEPTLAGSDGAFSTTSPVGLAIPASGVSFVTKASAPAETTAPSGVCSTSPPSTRLARLASSTLISFLLLGWLLFTSPQPLFLLPHPQCLHLLQRPLLQRVFWKQSWSRPLQPLLSQRFWPRANPLPHHWPRRSVDLGLCEFLSPQ